jgi:alpha-mannosidase
VPVLYDEEGKKLECQLEKESSNILDDQRKRVVFRAMLQASTMHRFSFYLKAVKLDEYKNRTQVQKGLIFENDTRKIEIDANTGFIKSYRVNGIDFIHDEAFSPVVMVDNADPWGQKVRNYRDLDGRFELLTSEESSLFAGINLTTLEPVRIIEDGEIRTIVEALFGYKSSRLALRYIVPRHGNEITLEAHVYWMEKDKMLKLSIPTTLTDSRCRGQDMFGIKEFNDTFDELVAQQWIGLFSKEGKALTIINDSTYGFDHEDGELRISLMRSPAYAGHPVDGQKYIVRQDRFEPRIDQGYHVFRFWMNAGDVKERLERIESEANLRNTGLMAVAANPPGKNIKIDQGITISDPAIRLATFKKAEDDDDIIIRLFETTGERRKVRVRIPFYKKEIELVMNPHEIKSIALDKNAEWHKVDLLERRLKSE